MFCQSHGSRVFAAFIIKLAFRASLKMHIPHGNRGGGRDYAKDLTFFRQTLVPRVVVECTGRARLLRGRQEREGGPEWQVIAVNTVPERLPVINQG